MNGARTNFEIDHPWTDGVALETWNDWWTTKNIAHGQTASESFLWSLVVAQVQSLDGIIQNSAAQHQLRVQYHRGIDEALDVYCVQLGWQDANPDSPPALMSFARMRGEYFPFFQAMIKLLLGQKGPSLPVNKYRVVASVVGAAFRAGADLAALWEQQWSNLVELVRHPAEIANTLGCEWPQSKGRWDGPKGYRAQMEAAQTVVVMIVNGR